MTTNLFKAILAMDAYNRGYNASVTGLAESGSIGSATIGPTKGDTAAQNTSFYAISYTIGSETIISYRGTDSLLGSYLIDGDIWNGYTAAGGGVLANQTALAFQFLQTVAGLTQATITETAVDAANISLVGHSLGGGLAGLVAGVYGKTATVFNNMPFDAAVQATYNVSDPEYELPELPSPYSPAVEQLVYGNSGRWTTDISGITTIYTEGEFLEALRDGAQSSSIPTLARDVGPNVDLPGLDSGALGGNLHSVALQVLLEYAKEKESTLGTDWKSASQYFMPELFSDKIATVVDAIDRRGSEDVKLSDVLLSAIAYSAIDSGTLVFGDTAIHALFNDANELGSVSSILTASTYLKNNVKDFSRIRLPDELGLPPEFSCSMVCGGNVPSRG